MSILNENDRLSPSDLKGYAVCIKLFGNKIKSPTFGLWLNILLFKNDFEPYIKSIVPFVFIFLLPFVKLLGIFK